MKVDAWSDLGKLRRSVGPLRHTDESLAAHVVSLLRDGSVISRIACATESLAFDALRICAGTDTAAESADEWLASEAIPLFAVCLLTFHPLSVAVAPQRRASPELLLSGRGAFVFDRRSWRSRLNQFAHNFEPNSRLVITQDRAGVGFVGRIPVCAMT